jgi:hypothetical protein
MRNAHNHKALGLTTASTAALAARINAIIIAIIIPA